MSVGRGCGRIGHLRPTTDVRRKACHPPLYPTVASGGQHGGWPLQPLVGHSVRIPAVG
jgi:hypothetical protein